MTEQPWTPPQQVERAEIIALSEAVLRLPDASVKEYEDVFRFQELGMEWDIGAKVYLPDNVAKGADGKSVGIYLLSGGDGDFKLMEPLARLLSRKLRYKVAVMTYPGRLYLQDKSRDWPGDTILGNDAVRTPIWLKDELISPDQYNVITDTSLKDRYGTRTIAKAKPGTLFFFRMAAWPAAFEVGGIETMKRHFPASSFSVYLHGHSTGGPFVCMLAQRVPNVAGLLSFEGSPFGYMGEARLAKIGIVGAIGQYVGGEQQVRQRTDDFDELSIRTWRDEARYIGPEALGEHGPDALLRLPSLIEAVFEQWENKKKRPGFKCEYTVTYNIRDALRRAALVTAERLHLTSNDRSRLVERFMGYGRELSGPGVKPMPPVLFSVTKNSREHTAETYLNIVMPMFRKMSPAPRIDLVQYMAGVHSYMKPEPDLPQGVGPAAMKIYSDAIANGYFLAHH